MQSTLNEDWLKSRSWDLWRLDTPITTIPDLLWFLNKSDAPLTEQRAAIEKFTRNPSWLPAPQNLKDAVAVFLVNGEITKGDKPGHVFHGNQWRTGEGGGGNPHSRSRADGSIATLIGSAAVKRAVEKGLVGGVGLHTNRSACKAAIAKDIAARMGTKWDHKLIESFNADKMTHDFIWRIVDGVPRQQGEFDEQTTAAMLAEGGIRGDDPRVTTALREEGVSKLIGEWANTANDTSPVSLAMQDAAEREFGITNAAKWDLEFSAYENKVSADDTRSALQVENETNGEMYQAFLRAQYEATQDYFKAAGITELSVYRGMKFDNGAPTPDWANVPAGTNQEVPLRPLSSFSYSQNEAFRFAGARGEGIVISGTVPVDRILSCARTGVGCLNEQEIVVLGGSGEWQVNGQDNFRGAYLSNANLEGADLTNLNFAGADLYNANLKNADLSATIFVGASAVDADFSGAKLMSTRLRQGDFTGANFTNANLEYTDVSEAILQNVDFSGANLEDVNFEEAKVLDARADDKTEVTLPYTVLGGKLVKL